MPAGSSFLLIRGGRIAGAGQGGTVAADILVEAGIIRAVGPPGLEAPADARVLSADDRLILPGLVNAHTHGDGTFAKGLGDRWTLELLLSAAPMNNAGIDTAEAMYLAAKLGAVEMLQNGATAAFDLFSFVPGMRPELMHAVARAYADVGMRAVIAPLTASRPLWRAIPGLWDAIPEKLQSRLDAMRRMPAGEALAQTRLAIETWPFDRDRIRPALCPTIPHHCDDDFIVACRDLAEDLDLRVQTHVAESKVQAVAGLELYGKSLLAHLGDLGLVGPRFVAAHGVWLDGDDLRLLADSGAHLVHNPASNLRLGAGIAPIARALRCGVPVALGTDGNTCADGLNMLEAVRLAAIVSRVRSHDPDEWISARSALTMATRTGSAALGFGDALGRIEPGAAADLVLVRLDRPEYWPLNDALRQVVYLESGRGIDKVLVDGRIVVDGGVCVSVDMAALRRDVEALALEVFAARDAVRPLVEALEPSVSAFCSCYALRPYPTRSFVCDTLEG